VHHNHRPRRNVSNDVGEKVGGHGACGRCRSSSSICTPRLKFVGFAIQKIWCMMCVSINGPGDPDFIPFDLEIGMLVASKVWNLPSKSGHARPLVLELFAMYATDGQTDGRTKAMLTAPFPTGRAIITLFVNNLKGFIKPLLFLQCGATAARFIARFPVMRLYCFKCDACNGE